MTIRDFYKPLTSIIVKRVYVLYILALTSLVSCQKETASNKNTEALLMDQYKESAHFYSTNLNDFQVYIEQYISQNPQFGMYPSFDSINKIKIVVDRTVADLDKTKPTDRAKLISDGRTEISRLSHYKYDFIDLKSLEGLNDSLYNQAIKTDLLKANYNIYLQYSHDKMKQ